MKANYILSRKAAQDIQQITQQSIADFGRLQTDDYMDGMGHSLDIVADSPDIGLSFIHSRSQRIYFRHRYVSHMIYYRQRKNDIFIIRILHVKMLPERHL